ncbi:pentapeptide repeat-containing protein [Methylobacterium marchantiae]|uniref:Pentapeptide repeat-containing protein n=1 Tax=Methylobacterium marchantiae TaxID=600331 RepID=A0ABW3WWX2_9HYPH|nr:hypothetical protein AIGOOFII_2351 [Methylobacterium marchantiae]
MTMGQDRVRRTPALDVHGAFIRRTNLDGANLQGADLSRADASGAFFRNADFKGARLVGTILKGADLTGAVNLTERQLASAVLDEQTRLPAYIDRTKLFTRTASAD